MQWGVEWGEKNDVELQTFPWTKRDILFLFFIFLFLMFISLMTVWGCDDVLLSASSYRGEWSYWTVFD